MMSVTVELGTNAATLLGPLIVAVAAAIGAWASNRRTKERVVETQTKVDQAHRELIPNGGSSMRDVIDRMAVGQAEMRNLVVSMNARLSAIEGAGVHAIERRQQLPPPPAP